MRIKLSLAHKFLKITMLLVITMISSLSIADEPITTDNRVKTYVYNENEVYPLVIYYGYQTSIEFAKGEEVSTISMGDSYSWQINPVGRRLFIKPFEENMHTNMTIITNKRAYQFDLFSKKVDSEFNNDLVYVMRFYYPDAAVNSNLVDEMSNQASK
jgi:type IV secretion system protein VirB9